jgi:hypothetical protein
MVAARLEIEAVPDVAYLRMGNRQPMSWSADGAQPAHLPTTGCRTMGVIGDWDTTPALKIRLGTGPPVENWSDMDLRSFRSRTDREPTAPFAMMRVAVADEFPRVWQRI